MLARDIPTYSISFCVLGWSPDNSHRIITLLSSPLNEWIVQQKIWASSPVCSQLSLILPIMSPLEEMIAANLAVSESLCRSVGCDAYALSAWLCHGQREVRPLPQWTPAVPLLVRSHLDVHRLYKIWSPVCESLRVSAVFKQREDRFPKREFQILIIDRPGYRQRICKRYCHLDL